MIPVVDMARMRIKIGDVFTLPVDDQRVGCGQVVATYLNDGYYFAIFDKIYDRASLPAAADVVTGRVALLALSLDAKLAAGHWEIIGHAAVPVDLPLPAYKEAVATPGQIAVVDYTGQRSRPATAAEAEVLTNRKIIAPVRLEKAFRALHGAEPWHEKYDELLPTDDVTTARLFS